MHLRIRGFWAESLGLALLLVLGVRSASCQVDLSAWPQVRIEVLAVNPDGAPVEGITADALVARGLRKPVTVTALEPAAQPQSVCVLIDASDSLGDGLSLVETKVRRLLRKLSPDDEVCVATFSSQLSIAQPLSADHAAALQTLAQLKPAAGTQLRDGLLDLAAYMRQSAHFKSRTIILVSDGADRHSAASTAQLKRELQTEGSPTVHMVCLPTGFGHALYKQVDQHRGAAFSLTEIGGGLTYFPHTILDIDAIMDHLPDTIRSRYVLTYQAENAARDGHEERIEISLDKAHQNSSARIQAPEGYYAPAK
jgi:Ca-activated chloride channel homolog